MKKIRLKAARINAKKTRKYVAESLQISPKTLQNWENGRTFPKQPMIEKLCEMYGVSYDDIDFSA